MTLGTIYGLTDPLSGEVRYVGKTAQPVHVRLRSHINARPRRSQLSCWLRSLEGVPNSIVLDRAPAGWDALEREWIRYGRTMGWRLTNGTEGGTGGALTGDALERMAESLRGKKQSAETRAKRSQTLKGRKITWNAKLSEAAKRRPKWHHTQETKDKIGAAHRGRKQSPEWVAKLMASIARTKAAKKAAIAEAAKEVM